LRCWKPACDERGVEGQVQDGCDYARRVGWGIRPRLSHLVIENNEAGTDCGASPLSSAGESHCRTAGPVAGRRS